QRLARPEIRSHRYNRRVKAEFVPRIHRGHCGAAALLFRAPAIFAFIARGPPPSSPKSNACLWIVTVAGGFAAGPDKDLRLGMASGGRAGGGLFSRVRLAFRAVRIGQFQPVSECPAG